MSYRSVNNQDVDDSLADAQMAMDQYHAGREAGEKPEFPQWAWNLIQAATQRKKVNNELPKVRK
jgi:hypothetical protein